MICDPGQMTAERDPQSRAPAQPWGGGGGGGEGVGGLALNNVLYTDALPQAPTSYFFYRGWKGFCTIRELTGIWSVNQENRSK